jgi:[protein-PII] uridylyltransferase
VLDALRAVVVGDQRVEALLARRRASAGPEAPPKIVIDNTLSDEFTVVEVKCPDRLGLLYLITRTMSVLGLDIASARIATEIDQAFDTFYVHDGRGSKLESSEARDRLRAGLEHALLQPL